MTTSDHNRRGLTHVPLSEMLRAREEFLRLEKADPGEGRENACVVSRSDKPPATDRPTRKLKGRNRRRW